MAGSSLSYPIRSDKFTFNVKVSDRVFANQTEFQHIEILDTEVFGKMLLLDGHIQLAELDEHAYHEALVHIPLGAVSNPKRALVVGGGDGGVLRELCKHPLERIDMVEIDQGVVDACRTHLPNLSNGAFDDPRVHLTIGDAFPFVKHELEPYDLIVIDATDTYEEEDGEISASLFTDVFYQDCLRILSNDGFVVTQADNLLFCPYSLEEIVKNFQRTFPVVGSYWAMVPSFGGFSGFCYAGKHELLPKLPDIDGLITLDQIKLDLAFTPLKFA
ncbi:MAG: hypothetical protein JST40_14060 [Armatimonadetes bacterium]|nr:hypothetical protein [Armatimonadota bacterium]